MGRVCCGLQSESFMMLAKKFIRTCIWQIGGGTRRYIYATIMPNAIKLTVYR